jgi:arylsulfatase I/J
LQGGFRAAAFVSGGWLPAEVQGTTNNEMMHVADWYTTFSKLVGVDPSDPWAKASNLPPVDGLDLTELITTTGASSPHAAIPVTTLSYIKGDYKLISTPKADFAAWSGPQFPNASSPKSPVEGVELDCSKGCLFDVVNDPTEHTDLAASMPAKVAELMADYQAAQVSFYSNNETGVMSCPSNITMPCACWMASHKYGGFLGPYQEVTV